MKYIPETVLLSELVLFNASFLLLISEDILAKCKVYA
jgi:hypothetical protein